jgi:hypothetical protein
MYDALPPVAGPTKKAEDLAENPETGQPENPPDLRDNSGRYYNVYLFKFC